MALFYTFKDLQIYYSQGFMNAFAWSLLKVVNYPYVYNEEVWALGDLAPGLHKDIFLYSLETAFSFKDP